MSWLKKVIPPKIKKIVGTVKKRVPDGVWHKCSSCGAALYNSDLEKIFTYAQNAIITTDCLPERG